MTFELSLLDNATNTVDVAGAASVTGNAACCAGPKIMFDGRKIPSWTVTVAAVSAIFGNALAWIAADPVAIPVTGTLTPVAPDAIVAVAGTVATAVLEELRLTVRPPMGAGADNVNVRFCAAVPLIVSVDGVKLTVIGKVTFTVELAFE